MLAARVLFAAALDKPLCSWKFLYSDHHKTIEMPHSLKRSHLNANIWKYAEIMKKDTAKYEWNPGAEMQGGTQE